MSVGRPCLDCGQVTTKTRCPSCQRQWDRDRQAKRGTLYKGDWAARSRAQRAAIPFCQWCGSTYDLTADHLIPGDPDSPIVTACRRCNSTRANVGRRVH